MFGYVQPLKPELKIKEYACYRSYYCGVCKSLGKNYNPICRLTVTYDAAFLALLNSSLMENDGKVYRERCLTSPFKLQPVIKEHEAVDYAAMINILLAYYKLIDGWKDERNYLSLAGAGFIKPFAHKIRRFYPELYRSIEEHFNNLNNLETKSTASIDEAADPFAKLLSTLLPFPGLEKTTRKVLAWMGYNLGKWIYIIDAFSDIENDLKSGSYNVLIAKYGSNCSAKEIREKSREEVKFVLGICLSEIGKAYDLLDIKRNSQLLENIIFLGLYNKTQIELDDRRGNYGSIQSTGSTSQCHTRRNQEGIQGTGEEISS